MRRRLGTVLLFAAVTIVNLPVIVVVLNGFKSAADITRKDFFPAHPTLHNFDVIRHSSFGTFMVNSLIVSSCGTAVAVVAAIFGVYALARFTQRGLEAYSGPLLAVATVPMVPSLLVYLGFQRYFVSGALAGAVKG